jgi:hypothetical protein
VNTIDTIVSPIQYGISTEYKKWSNIQYPIGYWDIRYQLISVFNTNRISMASMGYQSIHSKWAAGLGPDDALHVAESLYLKGPSERPIHSY